MGKKTNEGRPDRWTQEEDLILKTVLEDKSIKDIDEVNKIVSSLTNRTPSSCYSRAKRIYEDLLLEVKNRKELEFTTKLPDAEQLKIVETAKENISKLKEEGPLVLIEPTPFKADEIKGTLHDISLLDTHKTLSEMLAAMDNLIEDKRALLKERDNLLYEIENLGARLNKVTMERNQAVQDLNNVQSIINTLNNISNRVSKYNQEKTEIRVAMP